MGKIEKKIENDINFIKNYLNRIEENKENKEKESSDKKRNKLGKKIDADTRMIILYIKELNKLGVTSLMLKEKLDVKEQNLLNEILPNGISDSDMEFQKKYNSIIINHKKRILKIQEAIKTYPPYDPSLPVKEKLDNKIYKLEKNLGYHLIQGSDKKSPMYRAEWNYLEHFAESTEFTEEEREIIERSYNVGKEYEVYWDGKFMDWAEKGDAKIRVRKLSSKIFPELIRLTHPGKKYDDAALKKAGKELTKQFIIFGSDENRVQEALDQRELLKADSVERLKKMNAEGKLDDETYEYLLNEGDDVALLDMMMEKMGEAKAYFVFLIEDSDIVRNGVKELSEYTFEELGLE